MRKQWKGFVSGVLATILILGLGVPAMAATVRQLSATYSGIKITLDGKTIIPKDANGTVVEPFAVDGTTYLPVRAVADALGLGVEWDGANNTVVLRSQTSEGNVGSNVDVDNVADDSGTYLQAGGIFTKGTYITVDDVKFAYDGEMFQITNNSQRIVRVSANVVGVKSDGTYEFLQSPSFAGVDRTKYEQDLAENGWAVESYTNMIRPGETLSASMYIMDFSIFGDGYIDPDVDGDGYYDVIFIVSPQKDESSIVASTNDPVSDVYKIKTE